MQRREDGMAGDDAGPSPVAERVLFVDDDASLIAGIRRSLHRSHDVASAASADAALALIEQEGPFAVVASDLRMPGMDGVTFLEALRQRAPDTVRILLTGFADAEAAIAAVNRGNVFRLLCKPCGHDDLVHALDAGVRQYRLVTAERELLERTLLGSVDALVETLSLANPQVFARSVRVKAVVSDLLDVLDVEDRWPIEVAAMLAQLGAVALPASTGDRLDRGLPLDSDEQAMVDRLPGIGARLLAGIPRLDEVVAIIGAQGYPAVDESVPLGARVLRVALDYDSLEARHGDAAAAMDVMRARRRRYDPVVLAGLHEARTGTPSPVELREVAINDLAPGMVLASDVRTADGTLLVGRGQKVTESLLERMRNFAARAAVDAAITVRVPGRPS